MRIIRFVIALLIVPTIAGADTFTYQNESGETVTLEARLYGEGQGVFALEKADGQIEVVPEGAIRERKPGEGPTALTDAEMVATLTEKFGAERFRAQIKSPFVCGLVLSGPLSSKIEESRTRTFLKKATDFMKRIENIFEQFARESHLTLQNPTHPLVVLIFETDADFEKYALEVTGGRGLSAGSIAGFYSSLTNFLAIRMSECHTFETPLHEAIHQQVYNRQLLRRLAPLPAWYNEGIATGFEGNGDKITNGPVKINSRYAQMAAEGSPIGWKDLVADDRAFRGDIFAGDAYMHAWSMHWLLVNNYASQYTKYVKLLSQKEPLAEVAAEDRLKEFEEAFGKSPEAFQSELLPKLKLEIKKQKVTFKRPAVGRDVKQIKLAEVDYSATLRPQGILLGGNLTNISYIRDMAYYVTLETGSGLYADWYIPSVPINRSAPLKAQYAQKRANNPEPRLGATGVLLKVQSAPVDSDQANTWKRGQLPSP